MKYYLDKEPTERRAICRYNAGKCIASAWDWSGKVMLLKSQVRSLIGETRVP